MELYNYIKSLHLIFVITWFAGLFYIVRLFVYQIEANDKPSPEKEILLKQYKIMTYRLWYIITWPSAVLATIFALWLLHLMPEWLQMPWMQVKLGFVVLLFAYHFKCHQIYNQLQNDEFKYSSNFMRLWNEGATIILFAVVFLVILKNAFNWIFGVIGIVLFSVLIMLGFKFYKRIRAKNKS
ncbi:CopD family protein [Flavobacterium sp. J49]|uniref:CopD family protein n=1 Tax=Flavobacterium sp. J49 TaxID=2718534 RepID=UPI00159462DD|nr:CopD family protein [Flavobacterium sp. J49]MBF6641525.1 CopD family protein [Flavobacterium sp. J49]NIC02772.1 CopD family protein [Flavobacterium sp. J49]